MTKKPNKGLPIVGEVVGEANEVPETVIHTETVKAAVEEGKKPEEVGGAVGAALTESLSEGQQAEDDLREAFLKDAASAPKDNLADIAAGMHEILRDSLALNADTKAEAKNAEAACEKAAKTLEEARKVVAEGKKLPQNTAPSWWSVGLGIVGSIGLAALTGCASAVIVNRYNRYNSRG